MEFCRSPQIPSMSAADTEPLRTPPQVRGYVTEQMLAGVNSGAHPWHWPTLVTDLGGRVVVSRAYDDAAELWRFYSDRRAGKVEQLRRRPEAEVVFYHGSHRRQLRVQGHCRENDDEGFRQNLWQQLSPTSRTNYATIETPGTLLPGPGPNLPEGWEQQSEVRESAFRNFGVFELAIERYDFLQLNADGALRCSWTASGEGFAWLAP